MSLTKKLDRLTVAIGTGLVAATLVVVVISGGDGDPASTPSPPSEVVKVDRIVIRDFKFVPATAEVKVGTKLTFVNEDTAAHTATSTDDETFDTNILNKADEKAVTVSTPGTVAYICSLHAFMKGTIKVVS